MIEPKSLNGYISDGVNPYNETEEFVTGVKIAVRPSTGDNLRRSKRRIDAKKSKFFARMELEDGS